VIATSRRRRRPNGSTFKSVGLGNGSGGLVDDQDYVGVVIPWKWPNSFEGVTVADLRKAQAAVAAGRWRESPQAKD
jgi:hypothetical protein